MFLFLPMAQQPIVVHGLLIIESATLYTLGMTPLDEWSAWREDLYLTTHNTHERDIYAPSGIRTHNPSEQAAAEPHHAATGIGFTFCYRLFYKDFATNISFPLLYLLPDQDLY
jgi:hypothetical protein